MGTAVRWALDEFKYTGVRACCSGGDDVFMCMNDVVISATIVQCYASLSGSTVGALLATSLLWG